MGIMPYGTGYARTLSASFRWRSNYCWRNSHHLAKQSESTNYGAGDGNRTHAASLEGWNSTIELHPHNVVLWYNNTQHGDSQSFFAKKLAPISHNYQKIAKKIRNDANNSRQTAQYNYANIIQQKSCQCVCKRGLEWERKTVQEIAQTNLKLTVQRTTLTKVEPVQTSRTQVKKASSTQCLVAQFRY